MKKSLIINNVELVRIENNKYYTEDKRTRSLKEVSKYDTKGYLLNLYQVCEGWYKEEAERCLEMYKLVK